MAAMERNLEKVEELTTERYGKGAAVSVDEANGKCFVRCWNARGITVNEVSRKTREMALKAMLADLRLAKATAAVEDEDADMVTNDDLQAAQALEEE